MLTELGERIYLHSNIFKKELENIKKLQSEMNSLTKVKKHAERSE